MGTEHCYFRNEEGTITGHIALSTIDATFRYNDKKVNMYFHNYLGPRFFILENKEEIDFYPGEEDEYKDLWDQFGGWWDAKGKHIYK